MWSGGESLNQQPPISLYVHLPWCVKKCPYCDFNSHTRRASLDENGYVRALLNDLAVDVGRLEYRPVLKSIFIGGGTPSLFTGRSIEMLLRGIEKQADIPESAEITLEANPGSADEGRFKAYRLAGVNRLSIGIQSFNDRHLALLGRVHDKEQALSAVDTAVRAKFNNYNLDMMYCLPGQTLRQASEDVRQAVALAPAHISAYQLTIEPNTLFAFRPPDLPDEETGWQIQKAYWRALKRAKYSQYEISAYAKNNQQCVHNLNYWHFGDYLGIGAGAHGKFSREFGVYRTSKPKHPDAYLKLYHGKPARHALAVKQVSRADLPLEFMMNRLRLKQGFSLDQFEKATGLDRSQVIEKIVLAVKKGLLTESASKYFPSKKGELFLNDLLEIFIPGCRQEVA